MRPRRYSTEAIILSRKSYGEADRILTVYSKHYGKVQLLAKGVRYPKSRKRGHIEVFSLIRFSAAHGKHLDLITEAETLDSFEKVRKELKKVAVAYHLVDVVKMTTAFEEKNEKLFEIAMNYLNLLTATQLRKLRHMFIKDCLVLLGFWPLGKDLTDPDKILEKITERRVSSIRVGKKLLQ